MISKHSKKPLIKGALFFRITDIMKNSTGWGMPDYTARVTVTNNAAYTTPKDGYFTIWHTGGDSSGNAILRRGSSASGTQIGRVHLTGSYNSLACPQYAIPQGTYYFENGNTSNFTGYFYPCKGS